MFGLIAVVSASVVYATPASENQVQQAPVAFNAVQRQADRAGKDRWTRGETLAESSVEEEEEVESSSSKANVPKRSRRELNGDLHLGDW